MTNENSPMVFTLDFKDLNRVHESQNSRTIGIENVSFVSINDSKISGSIHSKNNKKVIIANNKFSSIESEHDSEVLISNNQDHNTNLNTINLKLYHILNSKLNNELAGQLGTLLVLKLTHYDIALAPRNIIRVVNYPFQEEIVYTFNFDDGKIFNLQKWNSFTEKDGAVILK